MYLSSMKTKTPLVIFFFMASFSCFAQNDSTAYQRLYADLVKIYTIASKPPVKNFYDVLLRAASVTFNPYNPHFPKAVVEISQQYHIEERIAVDTLFNLSFRELTNNDLWKPFEDVYQAQKPLFDYYNSGLCPCLTTAVTKTDTERMLALSVQNCIAGIGKDTAYVNGMKRVAGNRTFDEMSAVEPYMFLAIYQDCEILNYKVNKSIFDGGVYHKYLSAVTDKKFKEAWDVARYLKNKKMDSLETVFPNYKKFMPELTRFASKLNQPEITTELNYPGVAGQKEAQVNISLIRKRKEILGELEMTYSANTFNATIVSVKYTIFDPPRPYDEEIIQDIKVIPKQ